MPDTIGPDPTGTPELAALEERMRAAITIGHRPTATLTANEHSLLIAFCYRNEFGARLMVQQLQHFATVELSGDVQWSERRARDFITFRDHIDGANMVREERALALRTSNVVNLRERQRVNAPNVSNALNVLSPSELIEMKSPRLVGIGLLLLHRQGRIWYDDFFKRSYCDWSGTVDGATIEPRPVNDSLIRNVAAWMAQLNPKLVNVTDRQAHSWIETMAERDTRNPPQDWLNGLSWDGVERLGVVFSRGYGAEQSEFNIAAGRCWFVGMVARIMTPGCQMDNMIVLHGRQGIGKSQSLRLLGGDWYKSANSDIHTKDFLQEIFGTMLFEIPELHSLVTSNAAAAKVKAKLTNEKDDFRLPYGYTVERFYRTASFVGTTNNRDWHHDDSGEARRFWPIHCGTIDMAWLRENRAQLFAEAVAYFNLGVDDPLGQWWNVPADAQRELMEAETGEDPWENMIVAQLNRTDFDAPKIYGRDEQTITPWDGTLNDSTNWGNLLTVQRIALSWLRLSTEATGKRNTANSIGAVMRRLGWRRVLQRMPGSTLRVRVWIPSETEQLARAQRVVTVDDESPF